VNRWIPQPSRELQSFVLPMGVLLRWSLLVIWSLLYFGIKLWLETAAARLQAAESEAAARTSELRQLRAQVNPHFLFNALNSVLAEKDNASAVELITLELAEYLRFSLRPAGDCQTLGEELDALEHYLRVEKARYEEKLEYVIEAEPQVRRVRVPVATVQPLLENAMKYGRQTSPVPLRVVLSAALDRETGALRITVRNTGRWLEFDATRSHGIGLANLRRRLELLFGAEGQLTHGVDDGWVWVEVTLPADTKVEEAATNGMREGIA
jgi:LytS/YehU family sensor histidine kinase